MAPITLLVIITLAIALIALVLVLMEQRHRRQRIERRIACLKLELERLNDDVLPAHCDDIEAAHREIDELKRKLPH